jgi:hypothetical protein
MENFKSPKALIFFDSLHNLGTAGHIDITTDTSPKLTLGSTSQALCVVGQIENTVSISTEANFTLEPRTKAYSAIFLCKGSADSCSKRPVWTIIANGLTDTIGVHSTAFDRQTSIDKKFVYQGSAFSSGVFTSVNQSSTSGSYSLISLGGIGLLQGSLQVIWTRSPSWFFWWGELTWFSVSSFFILLPQMTDSVATIGYCPAHGLFAKKELIQPLSKMMDGGGVWLFRNLGGLRDSFRPKSDNPKHVPNDDKIPDCSYCSDMKYFRSPYVVGSHCDRDSSGPRPFGCQFNRLDLMKPKCQRGSAAMFTVVNIGEEGCFPAQYVEPLLGNSLTINPEVCVTSADLQCQVQEGSVPIAAHFSNSVAEAIVMIGVAISFVVMSIALWIAGTLYQNSVAHHLVEESMLNDRSLAASVHNAIQLSKYFYLTVDEKEVEGEFSQRNRDKFDLIRLDKQLFPTSIEPVKVDYFASRGFLKPRSRRDRNRQSY